MGGYICVLKEIDADSTALVGGKGANLGELTRANLPVPAAFCITTEAYRQHIEANALRAPILGELKGLNYSDPVEIEVRARAIREMIVAADIPAEIEKAISTAHGQLESQLGSNVMVSVRSSATLEDLPGASFAGQHDTYLNIQGCDNVISHIKRCWASVWTNRAISYRQQQGFIHDDVLLAVIVQEMFPSDVAGVMFTVNPVTSNPSEVFLNVSWGLGEAIVSGKVNPDQYIIDKASGAIKDRIIQEKLVMTTGRTDDQGSTEVEVPVELRAAETLTDAQFRELSEIGLRIEEHYGFPQDIEWGYSNGRFAILQSREVTAADIDFREGLEAWQTPVAMAELTDERWTWSRAYSDELQTGPSTPLMYSLAQPHRIRTKFLALEYMGITEFAGYKAEQFWDMPVFRWYGARAYYNTSLEKEWIRMFIPPFARDDIALSPFPEEEREEIRNMPFDWMRFVRILLKLEWKHPTRSLLGSTHYLFDNFEDWIRHSDEVLDNFDLESASVTEIFLAMRRANEGNELEPNVAMPFNVFLYWLPHGLQRLCEMWCDDENAQLFSRLVSGLQTPTGEQNIAVWELSRRVKASPVLTKLMEKDDPLDILQSLEESEDGRSFKASFDEFLELFGHRGADERDSYHFRWRQKPERVFPSIKALLSQGDEDSPALFEKRLHERMLDTKKECLKNIRQQPLGSLKAAFFKWYLELVQEYFYYRDWERFQNDKNGVRRRPMFCAIGRNFVDRGLMKNEEDIFFLGMGEIMEVEAGELTARDLEIRVRARRRVYDKYSHREPPKYVRGWETLDDHQVTDDGQGLRGIAASSGVVTGRARVCRNLDQIGRIEKGDILITVATDPAWTTVFSIIGGVIVEGGGVVSHAVMISREYGIPCVSSMAQACDLIPDGHMITVDGGTGTVMMH
ncbi:MAG: PEP/pyruvate-binding domain-containing protein [Pseudomonadales bacterium]|jgi:pyruvate,water dikinase|nr:PEP/pyruvate-binding domain-containing protein [Pseudomonadales bacterium]MDP6469652.1 PEP/pyruvate-binding domain-containing protein [Pseudomonadales bacterium]MDP6828893.1 PEP/pyruvate-binding domain-containing protein [Pseudomonadales bacterium]|tara:strand:+ start:4045 stop:6777 length:2733 start_codon:yes stop_codon:yes gene_type:complete